MTPIMKKLNFEQTLTLNFSPEPKVKPAINEIQVNELLARVMQGETVLVYDKPDEDGQAHTLVDKVRNYLGARAELIELNIDEAAKRGVTDNVKAFVIRRRDLFKMY